MKLSLSTLALAGPLLASAASAATIGATVVDASSGNYTLTSVSVTRGSAGTFTYVPGDLTNVTLTDVAAVGTPILVQRGSALPEPSDRKSLLEDFRLDTGIINPFGDGNAQDLSFEVTLTSPVVNSAGEDIIVFDSVPDGGSGDPTRFWISGADRDTGSVVVSGYSGDLLQAIPFTTFAYNNGGDANINDLAELKTAVGFGAGSNDSGNVRAAGIDLSSFGIPLGGTVTALRFQADTTTARLDPMLIVGLPEIPEPSGLALISLASLALARRCRGGRIR